MNEITTMPVAPPPELRFRRRVRPRQVWDELWQSRYLMMGLMERDLRVRYKQAFLGFAWALITPVILMIAFTLLFDRVADIDTGGAPYPLFSYLGLLPWTFFSSSVSSGGSALLSNNAIVNKLWCPREVFPFAQIGTSAVDFATQLSILAVLFVVTGTMPDLTSVWFPLFLVMQLMAAVAVTLLVSAVVVYVRDLRQSLPLILQVGLFITPVAYSLDELPRRLQIAYVVINPIAAVIEGYRDTILFNRNPDWALVLPALAASTLMLATSFYVFKRLETGIADVA
jgi:ABC-type polysaccharide/polyol phosphate export permease